MRAELTVRQPGFAATRFPMFDGDVLEITDRNGHSIEVCVRLIDGELRNRVIRPEPRRRGLAALLFGRH